MRKSTEQVEADAKTYVAELSPDEAQKWLCGVLNGTRREAFLNEEDVWPHDAVTGLYEKLGERERKKVRAAVKANVEMWRDFPRAWKRDGICQLLDLVREFEMEDAQAVVKKMASTGKFNRPEFAEMRMPAFRVMEVFANAKDVGLWERMMQEYPSASGICFRVLTRIAPERALEAMQNIADDPRAINGAARRLGGFVSEFAPSEHRRVWATIENNLKWLPERAVTKLQGALQEIARPF